MRLLRLGVTIERAVVGLWEGCYVNRGRLSSLKSWKIHKNHSPPGLLTYDNQLEKKDTIKKNRLPAAIVTVREWGEKIDEWIMLFHVVHRCKRCVCECVQQWCYAELTGTEQEDDGCKMRFLWWMAARNTVIMSRNNTLNRRECSSPRGGMCAKVKMRPCRAAVWRVRERHTLVHRAFRTVPHAESCDSSVTGNFQQHHHDHGSRGARLGSVVEIDSACTNWRDREMREERSDLRSQSGGGPAACSHYTSSTRESGFSCSQWPARDDWPWPVRSDRLIARWNRFQTVMGGVTGDLSRIGKPTWSNVI